MCGTAAAEAWPALFCTCEACIEARKRGGKDLRSRAAYQVDDRVRVDFGPDSNLHQQKLGLDYGLVTNLLVSHSHADHWCPRELENRRDGFSKVRPGLLEVWGNTRVEERFLRDCSLGWEALHMRFHLARPWEPIQLEQGLRATPVLAAHDPSEQCFNFLLEKEGSRVLLGHDTGWYHEEAWEFLSRAPIHLALLDCTYGAQAHDKGHLGCVDVVRARDELHRRGALAPDATVVATHFSHNGAWLHEDLERFFAPRGILAAYDGLRLTV